MSSVLAQQQHVTVQESSGVTLMARIRYPNGDYATQAATTSIVRRTYLGATVVEANTALVVNDTIFDTLQTTALDPRWTLDATGANFIDEVGDDVYEDGDKVYRTWYIIEPDSMARVVIPAFKVHVEDLLGE